MSFIPLLRDPEEQFPSHEDAKVLDLMGAVLGKETDEYALFEMLATATPIEQALTEMLERQL